MVRIGIVGYKMGNITSLRNALAAVGAPSFVAEGPRELRDASHIILPGVGAFPLAMENLRRLGFEEELLRLVQDEHRPLLGVCLGMQLLATRGEEHRPCEGLGLIPGRVPRLQPGDLRVPHVGWNDTTAPRPFSLQGPGGSTGCYYYVHSYHLVPDDAADARLECDYGGPVVAGVERGNVFGVQFHPEKSHADGLAVLQRFTKVVHC